MRTETLTFFRNKLLNLKHINHISSYTYIKKAMKTNNNITGVAGTLVVHEIVNSHWKSDWQKVDQENDDAIDGIIHIRKNGELTGEVIYAQVKSGDGYKVITQNRPNQIGINVGAEYLAAHKPRWNSLRGAVILIFVDNNKEAYWTNLKDKNSYSIDNKSIIIVSDKQRFGAHSKGHFKKIGDFFPQDRQLLTVRLERSELSYLKIDKPLKITARNFYKDWSNLNLAERTNPGLGEVTINRTGWRHISRSKRGFDKIFQSWQLLSAAKKIIQTVDKAYQITKQESTSEDETEYTLKDFVSLRAKVIFPNRHESVVQVILRRKKIVNRVDNTIKQKVWFYSVFEPRRGIRI